MLFQVVFFCAVLFGLLALVAIASWLHSKQHIDKERLRAGKVVFLVTAGILYAFISLVGLGAAAWGMETWLPWGVGIYPYLLLVVSFPVFLVLAFISLRRLPVVMWAITTVFPLAWWLAIRADRLSKGWTPVSDPRELLGTFLNAFTLVMIPAAIFAHLAARCDRRIKLLAIAEGTDEHCAS